MTERSSPTVGVAPEFEGILTVAVAAVLEFALAVAFQVTRDPLGGYKNNNGRRAHRNVLVFIPVQY